jgi:hypothetical protein
MAQSTILLDRIKNAQIVSTSSNYTTITIVGGTAGRVYGAALLMWGSRCWFLYFSAANVTKTLIAGASDTLTTSYNSSTYTYTLTIASTAQPTLILGGSLGRYAAVSLG